MTNRDQRSRGKTGFYNAAACANGYLRAALLAICLMAFSGATLAPATAADQLYQPGHVYVNYTSEWVPCGQGTLVDVTTQLVADDDDGHVHDIHGNHLTMDYSSNVVRDGNSVVTGFLYTAAPN